MENSLKKCKKLLERENSRQKLLDNGPEHLQSGVWGEELASAWLREKGYVILERDWHSGHRDIDIIARQGECTVFVEVKTRRNRIFGEPEEAVNWKKQKNLLRSINHYLNYKHIETPWRFDVITIIGVPGCSSPEINHIEDFMLHI
ncbi:MAG: YraN family protein [Prevotella sp.]|nr:YraN family protein [Prevotella sp.]MBR3480554.1 YraN family protein [Prevotella sp.]MBR6189657.1 YraN family protein [Prevotella sp.]